MMAARASLVLKNVTLPDGRVSDISTGGGVVLHVGAGWPCDRMIDCTGLLVLPGATDIHVHMRGGSQSGKEDWQTGSKSALAGGVTLVVDQPNTVPPLTTPELFANRVREAEGRSACHFAINSALTANTDIRRMWGAGAMAFGETFYAPSSYGAIIGTSALERSLIAIRALGGLVTIHAEKVNPVPDNDLAGHDRARPVSGEMESIQTVQMFNRSGCRLHFCHVSSTASVDAVMKASFEVTPHHLFLSYESFSDPADPEGKVNPPLRSEKERKGLWARWDRIDIIASDHAPHTVKEKRARFADAPAGIPGVETMIPLLVAKVLDRTITLPSLIQKTSAGPAALLGIPQAGFNTGDRADFAIYEKVPARIHADNLHYRCGWTPYEGMPAVFPKKVIMDGIVVYHDGEFIRGTPRWFAGKGYRA
ncbi:MAG: dihydroorotase [Methanoregula sp. PtaU1.Bin051]|nr:MAG: dihydroorotase [Methanoregula sp. PtaU1.Bin051]